MNDAASSISALFDQLWLGYQAIAPQAEPIRARLAARGEKFGNDHVAFRTFNVAGVGIDVLAAPFIALGYRETGTYDFVEKQLFARSFGHPTLDVPRVFLSELLVERFSQRVQDAANAFATARKSDDARVLITALPTWPAPDRATYEALTAESEYAGWVAGHGIRANHFTISVNDLKSFADIDALNTYLRAEGFALNGTGRQVQGSPELLLEQSSTLAPRVATVLADGVLDIPGAYYEFARRYPEDGGALYDGFRTASADKIFESTNAS